MGSGQLSVKVKRQKAPPYRQKTAVELIGLCVGRATRLWRRIQGSSVLSFDGFNLMIARPADSLNAVLINAV